MSLRRKLRTYARLGPSNVARVAAYRLGLKSGFHPVQRLRAAVPQGPFLRPSERKGDIPPANTAWNDAVLRFGWHRSPRTGAPPDWFANPFTDATQPDATRNWWHIPDFGAGDIKGLWDLSRLDWVVAGATRVAGGDDAALASLNDWLADWARENPPYKGPNWKCGQEASIRVMHLVAAAWITGQDSPPEPGLVDLLSVHLQRIAPTMAYAIGQQNNHGTSEAAALFIGGTFLAGYDPRADAWARKGRRWLEERAKTLIAPDGSFSQHSVTYHRVMLDSYALAEAWRRHRGLRDFPAVQRDRLAAATRWLDSMVDRRSGDAPNIGANDGAMLLPLTGCDYRDFRPSVQLAAALFQDRDAFGGGPWAAALRWLSVPPGAAAPPLDSASFDEGGYHVLRTGDALAVMRFPRFRFRPGHADALHVDLWHDGVNLLRDAGTYSYNATDSTWYSGTAAHNTVAFDDRDQMARIGRFLFADWLSADAVESVRRDGQTVFAAAAYTDAQGARHHRQITLSPHALTCEDAISGTFRTACLRWRLASGAWAADGPRLRNGGLTLATWVDGAPVVPTLGTTAESRYYQQTSDVPLATVRVDRPAKLLTQMTF